MAIPSAYLIAAKVVGKLAGWLHTRAEKKGKQEAVYDLIESGLMNRRPGETDWTEYYRRKAEANNEQR